MIWCFPYYCSAPPKKANHIPHHHHNRHYQPLPYFISKKWLKDEKASMRASGGEVNKLVHINYKIIPFTI